MLLRPLITIFNKKMNNSTFTSRKSGSQNTTLPEKLLKLRSNKGGKSKGGTSKTNNSCQPYGADDKLTEP